MLLNVVALCAMATPLDSLLRHVDVTVMETEDSLMVRVDATTFFKVSRWEVDTNSPALRELDSIFFPLALNQGWRIDRMELRGAASPEGPVKWNITLAHNRRLALYRYINQLIPAFARVDKEHTYMSETPEDYAKLVRLMRLNNDPYTDKVETMVNRYGRNLEHCKQRLQEVENGRMWKYLLANYYPQLRAADLTLWLYSGHGAEDSVASDPEIERQMEAYNVAHRSVMPLVNEVPVGVPPYVPIERLRPDIVVPTAVITPVLPVLHFPSGTPQDTVPETPKDTVLPTPQDSVAPTERINRREMLSIKTNLILDLAYVHKYGMAWILNGQVEYYPKHGHITPVLSFDGPWWQNRAAEHKYFQVRNYQAEARWYFRKEDARYDGWYAGIYGHGMLFGVGFNGGEGYQGEGWGVGLSGGYVLPLIKKYKHLKLEFGIQVGYFRTKYDPYVYGCPVEQVEDGLYYYNWTGKKDDFVPRQWLWQWFGPTRVGITITYDLLYRKHSDKNRPMDDDYNKDIKGASFIWHE